MRVDRAASIVHASFCAKTSATARTRIRYATVRPPRAPMSPCAESCVSALAIPETVPYVLHVPIACIRTQPRCFAIADAVASGGRAIEDRVRGDGKR
jgi:hypothetical protein